MNDLTRGERLQIMLTTEELEALDNWRFAKRMPSRAAAIRELFEARPGNGGLHCGGWRQKVPGLRRYAAPRRLRARDRMDGEQAGRGEFSASRFRADAA